MMNFKSFKIIKSEVHKDNRGKLISFNEMDFKSIKRIYKIKNLNTKIKRGWQYHENEEKIFYVTKGEVEIGIAKMNEDSINIVNPVYYKIKKNDEILLVVPSKHANCIQNIKEGSEVMVFSNFYLEESLKDKIRIPTEI